MPKPDEILTKRGIGIIRLITTKGGFRCLCFHSLFRPLGPAQGFSSFFLLMLLILRVRFVLFQTEKVKLICIYLHSSKKNGLIYLWGKNDNLC